MGLSSKPHHGISTLQSDGRCIMCLGTVQLTMFQFSCMLRKHNAKDSSLSTRIYWLCGHLSWFAIFLLPASLSLLLLLYHLWELDIFVAMQSHRLTSALVVSLRFFVTVYAFSSSGHVLSIDAHVKALEPRQEPGVVATPDFLRRGYHACKCGLCKYTASNDDVCSYRSWQLDIHRRRGVLVEGQWNNVGSIL